jgi:hypothetical protein
MWPRTGITAAPLEILHKAQKFKTGWMQDGKAHLLEELSEAEDSDEYSLSRGRNRSIGYKFPSSGRSTCLADWKWRSAKIAELHCRLVSMVVGTGGSIANPAL